MKRPDYKYITQQSLEIYDKMCALTFETHSCDKIGGELISKACSAIAELHQHSKQMEKNGESKI